MSLLHTGTSTSLGRSGLGYFHGKAKRSQAHAQPFTTRVFCGHSGDPWTADCPATADETLPTLPVCLHSLPSTASRAPRAPRTGSTGCLGGSGAWGQTQRGAPRMQSATSWGQGGGGNTASGRQLVCRVGRHELSGVLNPGRPPISKRWGSAGGDCSRTVLAGTWGCPQWGWEKAACSPRGWNQGPQGGTPACSTPLGFLCSTGRLLPLPAGVCPTFQGLCQAAAKPLPLITGSQT